MILESAQMLSVALRINRVDQGYQITHLNQPCTIWARKSLSNWKWLRQLASALNGGYRFRFEIKTNHQSYDVIQSLPLPKIQDCRLTSFVQAMPEKYKHKNPVTAYINFYVG
jgi:hypothetical protein